MRLDNLKCVHTNIDIDEYLKIREEIKSTMSNPTWLGDFTKKDIIALLNNNSKIWMFYNNDEFVCSMMSMPSDKNSLESFELNNLNYEEVIDYGPMFVSPKYRGQGLQYQMLNYLDEYYKDQMSYAIITIHPKNIYSINNIFKDKFKLINTKTFTRGLRNIYLKKL